MSNINADNKPYLNRFSSINDETIEQKQKVGKGLKNKIIKKFTSLTRKSKHDSDDDFYEIQENANTILKSRGIDVSPTETRRFSKKKIKDFIQKVYNKITSSNTYKLPSGNDDTIRNATEKQIENVILQIYEKPDSAIVDDGSNIDNKEAAKLNSNKNLERVAMRAKESELKAENRDYELHHTGLQDENGKHQVFILYQSRGEKYRLNCRIKAHNARVLSDEEFNKKRQQIYNSPVSYIVCRYYAKLWIQKKLKLGKLTCPEDLTKALKKISLFGVRSMILWLHFKIVDDGYLLYNTFLKVLKQNKQHNLDHIKNTVKQWCTTEDQVKKVDKAKSVFSLYQNLTKIFNGEEESRLRAFLISQNPIKGHLLDDSNNKRVYSCSKNSFPTLIKEICDNLKDKPERTQKRFIVETNNHDMCLSITKENGAFRIRFYDCNDTLRTINIITSSLNVPEIKIEYFLHELYLKAYEITSIAYPDIDNYHTISLLEEK